MRPFPVVLLLALLSLSGAAPAAGAPVAPPVRGIVTDSAGIPLANARVTLVPSRRVATTDAAGVFLFRSLSAGEYHIDVSLMGYAPGHVEITVPADGDEIVVRIMLAASPLALEGVIVTGTPGGSDPLTITQSSTQVSGRELDRQVGSSVAATLDQEPGITARYAGPGAALPVIRGLTDNRVVMLENGQRTGDLAGSSSDHASTVDPLSATRLEVVRGPASLLYGSGALGGVVNVIGTDIPTNVPSRVEGFLAAQGLSATPGGAVSGQALLPISPALVATGRVSWRRLGDVRVGDGALLENTAMASATGGAGIGYVAERISAGISLDAHRFDYGVPFGHAHHEGEEEEEHEEHAGVDLNGTRYGVTARSDWNPAGATFRGVNLGGSAQWYEHDEIEPDGATGTTFVLRSQTADLRADVDLGVSRGTFGVSGFFQQYEPTGEEALTPFADHASLGIFAYQEVALAVAPEEEAVPTLQVGARFDSYDLSARPSDAFEEARNRLFRAFSGSVGVNVPFGEGFAVSGSVARAFRAPSVEELFSNGLHAATSSYDVGNPDLEPEVNLGLEGIFRAHTRTVNALLSAYYNHIDDYIAPRVVGDTLVEHGGEPLEIPLNRFMQEDASLMGIEGKVELLAGRAVVLGARGDRVRGRFATGAPLPYMPAARLGGDVRFDNGRYSAGVDLLHAFAQEEVSENELATAAYTLLNVGVGYSRTSHGLVHSLTLRAENLTDAVYREATSRIKALAPNPGRNVSLVYRVLF